MREEAKDRDRYLIEPLDESEQCKRKWWTQEADRRDKMFLMLKMPIVALTSHLHRDLTDEIILGIHLIDVVCDIY